MRALKMLYFVVNKPQFVFAHFPLRPLESEVDCMLSDIGLRVVASQLT